MIRFILTVCFIVALAVPIEAGDCSDVAFSGSSCYPAEKVATDTLGDTLTLQALIDDMEIADTVAAIETAAATATQKTIMLPSGTWLSNDHHGTATATGGSSAGGAGGVGEFTFADADAANLATSDYILITGQTSTGPSAGEFCKVTGTSSAGGTTTATCDVELSAAPDADTVVEFSDPVRLIPTTDDPVIVDCGGSSGFGGGGASQSSFLVEIDRSIYLKDCWFSGLSAHESEAAVIQRNSSGTGQAVIVNPRTTGLTDIEATGIVDEWVQGDRFWIGQDDNLHMEISGGRVDASHPWEAIGDNPYFYLYGTWFGTTNPEDDNEFGCFHHGNYLDSDDLTGTFIFRNFFAQYCRWFNWQGNPTVVMEGEWYWPSYIYDHDHPAMAFNQGRGVTRSDGGTFVFDLVLIGDPDYTDANAATPVGLPGDTPNTPLHYAFTGSLTADLSIYGNVVDQACFMSRQSGILGGLLQAKFASGTLKTALLKYMQGDVCNAGAGNLVLIDADHAFGLDSGSDIHIYSRYTELHCVGDVACTAHQQVAKPFEGNTGFTAANPVFTGTVNLSSAATFTTNTNTTIGDGAGGEDTITLNATIGTDPVIGFGDGYIDFARGYTVYFGAPTDFLQISGAGAVSLHGAATLVIPKGTDPAATCVQGEIYMDTDTSNDTNCTTTFDGALCRCKLTNTWQGE